MESEERFFTKETHGIDGSQLAFSPGSSLYRQLTVRSLVSRQLYKRLDTSIWKLRRDVLQGILIFILRHSAEMSGSDDPI
jgi:hypothetical protein